MSADGIFGPPSPNGLLPISGAAADFWDPAPAGAVDRDQKPILYGEGATFMQNTWDVVYLNSAPLPGICEIKAESELQIDQKKGPGHDGARLTLHGYLPGPIVITVKMWTADQWDEYLKLVPVFWRPPKKNDPAVAAIAKSKGISIREANLYQAAVTISHPSLRQPPIDAVIVRGISIPEKGPEPQTVIVRLKCVQYLPPTEKAPHKVKDAKKVAIDARVDAPKAPHETGTGPRGARHPE